VAAGGLAVGAHQDREQALHLLKGPALDPQKEQRSAVVSALELTFEECYGFPASCQQVVSCDPARRLASPNSALVAPLPWQG
jgi:hypothetical protein